MTPAERARQIDAEEFKRDSKRALDRALAYSKQKQDERRRRFLVAIYGEEGKTMPLWDTVPREGDNQTSTLGPTPIASKIPKFRSPLRTAELHTINGQTLTIKQWAEHLGVNTSTLFERMKKLGSITAAIERGGRQRRTSKALITYDGLSLTRKEWAEHLGINYNAFCGRVFKHGADQAIAMGGPNPRGPRPRPANDNAPGVVSDFAPVKGTGAGAVLQETPNITFSDKAKP